MDQWYSKNRAVSKNVASLVDKLGEGIYCFQYTIEAQNKMLE